MLRTASQFFHGCMILCCSYLAPFLCSLESRLQDSTSSPNSLIHLPDSNDTALAIISPSTDFSAGQAHAVVTAVVDDLSTRSSGCPTVWHGRRLPVKTEDIFDAKQTLLTAPSSNDLVSVPHASFSACRQCTCSPTVRIGPRVSLSTAAVRPAGIAWPRPPW